MKISKKVASRISGCLLAVLSFVGAAIAQNTVIPTPAIGDPNIALTHSLNGNPYGLDVYYTSTMNVFSISGVGTSITFPPAKLFCTTSPCPSPVLSVTIQVDNTGKLIGGNPNSSQPDLVLTGQITNGTTTYTSPLLTGQITAFYFDGVNGTPNFAFLFTVTGGSMASLYQSTNSDLWLTLSLENQTGYTNFAGSFATDFGGVTKANIYGTQNLSVTCGAVTTGDVGVPFDSGPMNVTGGTTPYSYSIVGTLPPGLTLNTSTGEVTGTPTEAGTFTVKVTDAAGMSSTSCMITINGPLSVTCAATLIGDVGVPFNSGPMNVTGGTAPYSYSIVGALPPGLTLNTSTGAVTGTPTAAGTFTVKVTDATGNSSTSCMITINGPLSVTCAAINTGTMGVPFDSGPMTVSGGTAPYSYSIVGTLPPGLTLNTSTGEVTGTPTEAGTFTVKVTDATGNSSTSCAITINPVPLAVTCTAINTGDVGVPFDSGPMSVTGGSAPYSYSIVGTLPPGLTLNTSTGEVTGTPTEAGTFTVRVTDAAGMSSTSCMITINSQLSVTCAAINTGDVGVPFDSGPMTVTGGTAPYTYSLAPGNSLPAGLTLNTSTGEITGTPTAAGTFTVEVTDALGNSSTSCMITINGPLSVNCAAINTGDVGVPFDSGPMTVTGGTTPYTFSIVGVLPAGLTLNTMTGEVTGTPTASGTFAVQVTDAVGNSSTSCLITINGPLSVTCAATLIGDVGVPFDSGAMTVTGGTMPYTFSIVGVLPAGLMLNTSTGEITGTPATSGTFTVQVTDATGNSSSSCAITINAALSVSCAAVTTGDVGVPFNSGPMMVTGGTAPYSYSILGLLPAGLTLNTSTGAVTGTPTTSGTFTVQVTDATGNSSSSCAITINAALSVSCAAVTAGDADAPFNSGPMTVTGGTAPYTYSIVGALPVGLSLNMSNGAISGTPATAGTFTVKVTDATGNSSTSCIITINTPLFVAQACTANDIGDVGVPFNSGPMNVTGGTAPYTYSIVGVLPAGLTLDTSTGAVTGTPTTSGTFTVQVMDATGNYSTSCMMTINGPLSVSCAAVTTGDVSVPFNSGPINVTGGTAPYTYSIVGTLPAGLSLNAGNGAISGTPTTSGTFSVQVTDATGATSSACAITINSALSVSCAAVTTGDVGVPFNSGPMNVTGGTAPYSYSIVGVLPAGLSLNTSTGAVTGTPMASGTFTVRVTDAAGMSSTSCMITINGPLSVSCAAVTTGDVGAPFNSGPMAVMGGTAPYSYSILGVLPAGLTLNTSTGAVTGTPTASGTFTVQVTDATGNSSTSCMITINGPLSVSCAAINTGDVGVPFNSGPMNVTGGTAPYSYSIVGTLPAGLSLNTSTGAVTGTPTASGTFTVQVTDATGNSSTSCMITINGPLSVSCAAVTTGDVGVPFNSGPMNVTGGTAPYSYSIVGVLPAGLSLNTSNGAVTGTPTASGTFTVRVTDATGNSSTSCMITINGPLSVTCAAINTGDVGVPFNSGPMNVTGGTAPYTYSIVGVLPAGLTLNTSTGAVTGTPTASGTFTVQVTDATGNSSTSCMITINGPLSVSCAAINTGDVGVPFNSGPMTVTGGTAPYTYSIVGVLPAGLTLNTSTGAVTGTPTASGAFTVQVTDATGNSSTSCMITINGPLSVSCAAVTTGEVGVPFNSGPMTVTGGTAPFSYSIVGTLPAGLSLNTSNGAVTGTPTTAGTFSVKVTDANGAAGTACAITIVTGPSVSCSTNTSGQVGVSFNSGSITVSGGMAPYTFSVVGTLPAGLSLSTTTGAVTGTPTAAGSFSIQVRDANGIVGNATCPITISSSTVSATCVSISAQKEVAITPVTLVGSGGTGGSYTFSATGLPSGLKMSSNGTISGTPTATGTFTYTVTVTDAAGHTGTLKCSITVAPPITSNCGCDTVTEYQAMTPVTLTASGGSGGPYTFTASGLPAGLSISSSGTISGTATVSGEFNYTVTITDNSGHSTTIKCMITVKAGSPVTSTCACSSAQQGVALTPVTMVGSGGVGGPYTFSATGLPAGLSISSSGTISGTPTVSGTFSYTVTVTDSAGNKGTVTCTITVKAAPPVTTTCACSTAQQGVALTPVTMVGSGGVGGPYTFSASGLPASLSISSSGTISGTPTVSGTFSYTVTVTDSAGNKGTVTCTITVKAAPPVTTTCACSSAQQGVALTPMTMVGSGGVGGPYTFSASSLPAGLSISSSGTISGTPTVSGTFSYTVTVTDSAGNKGTVTCTITVKAAPPVTSSCGCDTVTKGKSMTPVTLTASGGTGGPYTFSASGLPAGLSISSSGTISGKPTVTGEFNYTVTITDHSGDTGTIKCMITVN